MNNRQIYIFEPLNGFLNRRMLNTSFQQLVFQSPPQIIQ